jgi:hypothetical protein
VIERSNFSRLLIAVVVASCALLPSRALHAQEREQASREEPSWTEAVQRSVAAGSYLPLSLAPDVGASTAQAGAQAGYDGARDAALLRSFAQATVYGPLALRLGVASSNAGRVAPSVGGRVQLLKQPAHGVDFAASLFYKAEGFTELEGEIEGVLSVARRFDAWLLLSTLAYGQDPEGRERDAEITLACLLKLSRIAQVGLDARGRFGLGAEEEQEEAERADEPEGDLQAGPVLNLALGPVVLSAQGGVSALRRADETTRVGLIAAAGLGSAF